MASDMRDAYEGRPRGRAAQHVESSFEADGHCVRVSIRRLGEAERERVAAQMAWFADLLSTPGVDVEASGWMSFVQRLLDDVAITVDDHVIDRLQDIWDQVVGQALRAYIDANRLDASLKQRLRCGSISLS